VRARQPNTTDVATFFEHQVAGNLPKPHVAVPSRRRARVVVRATTNACSSIESWRKGRGSVFRPRS
jgi:hypothetical protein